MKRIVIGVYGSTLDYSGGRRDKRWNKWRPSVAVCAQPGLPIDRFVLLHGRRHERDATQVAADIQEVSPDTEVELRVLDFDDPWDFEEVFSGLLDFARETSFDVEHEETLIHITTGTHVLQICWFLLAESRHVPGKLLQASPPASRDAGVHGTVRIIDLDLARYDHIAKRFRAEREESVELLKSGIATRSAAFNRMIESIEQVAIRSKEPILLTGPTGAGKSHLAKQIHALRRARKLVSGNMVEVNCATIRGDGAMSVLFGHVKGAFTGAQRDRPGLLRAADGGLLFLDEIGELGLEEQAMLLRAIEEKQFRPVGTDREVRVDFQLIAGTNRDLNAAVGRGEFREDLLTRIQLWSFELPGLAARREDIEPNLDYELARVSDRLGQNITMNAEARARFVAFAKSPRALWLGNFRDLGAAVLRMATLAPAGRIDEASVSEELQRLELSWRRESVHSSADDALLESLLRDEAGQLDLFDRVQLLEVLRVCQRSSSLSDAGRVLFAASRERRKVVNDADRLRKYLARFSIEWSDIPR